MVQKNILPTKFKKLMKRKKRKKMRQKSVLESIKEQKFNDMKRII
jgi:hypothetical protein